MSKTADLNQVDLRQMFCHPNQKCAAQGSDRLPIAFMSKTYSNAFAQVYVYLAISVLGYCCDSIWGRYVPRKSVLHLSMSSAKQNQGAPLLSAIYGGGQLSIFVGWIGKYQSCYTPSLILMCCLIK